MGMTEPEDEIPDYEDLFEEFLKRGFGREGFGGSAFGLVLPAGTIDEL